MQLLFKGAFYRLLGVGFNFLIGFLIAMLSGKELFGSISLLLVNAGILYLITGWGNDASILWHGAGQSLSYSKTYTLALSAMVFQILLYLVFSSLYMQWTGRLLLSQLGTKMYLYECAFFAGLVITEKYSSLMFSRQQTLACNSMVALYNVMAFALLILLYLRPFLFKMDPFQLFCLLTLGRGIWLALFFHWQAGAIRLVAAERQELRSFFHFSILVFATNILQLFAYRIDYWLINYYHDRGAVGVFSQACRFAQLLWVVPTVLAAVIPQSILKKEAGLSEKELQQVLKLMALVNLILTPLLLLVAFIAYRYWLTDFSQGFTAILLMLPGVYLFGMVIPLPAFFSAKRLLWINFFGTLICLLLILVLDLWLIPIWGGNGAALANSVAYSVAAIFLYYNFNLKTNTSIKLFFSWNTIETKKVLKSFFNK